MPNTINDDWLWLNLWESYTIIASLTPLLSLRYELLCTTHINFFRENFYLTLKFFCQIASCSYLFESTFIVPFKSRTMLIELYKGQFKYLLRNHVLGDFLTHPQWPHPLYTVSKPTWPISEPTHPVQCLRNIWMVPNWDLTNE